MTIIEQIKSLRKQAGLTQSELAKRAGINKVNLCEIEKGKKHPGSKMLEKIARGLNKEWRLI